MKLALLGCGNAARKHARTLRRIGGVELAFASRDGDRARAFARRSGGAAACFDSYAAAIAAPDVAAVVVTTPPSSHLDLTLAALHAGKHAVVEKPPFLHSGDFDAVRAAEREGPGRAFVAENYAYKPLLLRLRELLQEGAIGEPLFVQLNALKTQRVADWRDDPETAGGGALYEGGIHWVCFAAELGLSKLRVHGLRPGDEGRRQAPDRSIMLGLEYEDGPVGSLLYSWEVPSLLQGLRISRIWGREGSITFESNGLFVILRGRRRRILFPGVRDMAGYRAMFEDFLRAMRDGSTPAYDLDAAQRDLELVEQAYATAAR